MSKMTNARRWHWIDFHVVARAGLPWQPKTTRSGRYLTSDGYVRLTRRGLSAEDVEYCEQHGLFLGRRKMAVAEHQLVACRKYGALPEGTVVRHQNGVKSDNRPENLILGTTQENTADHNTARLAAMFWREQAFIALLIVQRLLAQGYAPAVIGNRIR